MIAARSRSIAISLGAACLADTRCTCCMKDCARHLVGCLLCNSSPTFVAVRSGIGSPLRGVLRASHLLDPRPAASTSSLALRGCCAVRVEPDARCVSLYAPSIPSGLTLLAALPFGSRAPSAAPLWVAGFEPSPLTLRALFGGSGFRRAFLSGSTCQGCRMRPRFRHRKYTPKGSICKRDFPPCYHGVLRDGRRNGDHQRFAGQVEAGRRALRFNSAAGDRPQPQRLHQPTGSPASRCSHARQAAMRASTC